MLIFKEHIRDTVKTSTVMNAHTGDMFSINNETNKNYENFKEQIVELLKDENMTIDAISNAIKVDNNKYDKLREDYGITINTNNLIIDNGNAHAKLPADIGKIFRDIRTEKDVKRLIAFATLLSKNPYEHAKESLVHWIMTNPSLIILDDGRIQGYRGLNDNYLSIRSGYGIVNTKEIDGQLDNTPGNIIEFPRELIDHNPANICSVGLHVGTIKYALRYGRFGKKVTVAFSPEDVVSTVYDAQQEKIRVCKMEILKDFTHDVQFINDMTIGE